MYISTVPVFKHVLLCPHHPRSLLLLCRGCSFCSEAQKYRAKTCGQMLTSFSPFLLGGREAVFDSASKCYSTFLQILHVLAPHCCAVLALCGVVCACLDLELFLSFGHREFCHAPMALNTSGFSIWYRGACGF